MTRNIYIRQFLLGLSGIVIGLMSVSLVFDFAMYKNPNSEDMERLATQYYFYVRTSFVPYIVTGTLLSLVASSLYRVIFMRNWRTYLIAIGVFALSIYYVTVVFGLEDNLPKITELNARVDSLLQIGFAHFLTWLAGWFTMLLLLFETDNN
ncbi:hypothetical protein [Leptospira sp. GIMC2001]|uniref:hypothetical protein n=1 Tax=Leptospira sp. GIMC2001 TaxID=1513297 RepID=UPI00234BD42B|nr:hypothetical protein [Leptospira sp. GIMC2001]WCL48660.1 hypothetical protein O4O04_15305 [Leptospira sp. GIMC2001]